MKSCLVVFGSQVLTFGGQNLKNYGLFKFGVLYFIYFIYFIYFSQFFLHQSIRNRLVVFGSLL